jgi:hypothetical protein
LLAAGGIWAALSPVVPAGDWESDFEPREWDIAMLEQLRDGYLEREKIAVGCSRAELFVQRYSPAGHTPTSIARFDGGADVVIVWDKLDPPNTMWAYGSTAQALIERMLLAETVSFREIDRSERVAVAFDFGGADQALMPVLVRCGKTTRSKTIAIRAQ